MKRTKCAEQESLRVVWRGNFRELSQFVSKHFFGLSIVRRVGNDSKLLSILPKDSHYPIGIVKEWLKENGDLVPSDVNVRMSFSRPAPKAKKLRVDESHPPPNGSIERLKREWKHFLETGCCPKCGAVILGPSIVYDDVCDKMHVLSCMCGKHIDPGAGAHLKEADQRGHIPRKGLTHHRNPIVSV